MSENRIIAASKKRATNGSWKKGQSGNPGGRPKRIPMLAEKILELTDDGKKLAEMLFEIATGANGADVKDQTVAIRILLEYGIGKPREHIEHSVDESLYGAILFARKSQTQESEN